MNDLNAPPLDGPTANEVQSLPSNVRRLWEFAALVPAGILLILGVIVDLGARSEDVDLPFPPAVVPLVIALGLAALLWWFAGKRYDNWTFALTDSWIEAQWGVLNKTNAVIPRNRVQTLTLEHGPIDRALSLETVTVHTAGAGAPNLTIPHVRPETVTWLKSELGLGAAPTGATPPIGPPHAP